MVRDTDRKSATELMTAVGLVDLLIPRGGAGLIRACTENAKVPCIETGTGICHIYVDAAADLDRALAIVDNAKTSRPSVCNAAEVCLVHSAVAEAFLPRLKARLVDERAAAGLRPVELRLDPRAAAVIDGTPANEADFDTEFLDYMLAVRVVDGVEEAAAHIAGALDRPQRVDRDGGRTRGGCVYVPRGQRGGVRQRLHAVYRRRRVRPGLRDGDLHAKAARARPNGARGADLL